MKSQTTLPETDAVQSAVDLSNVEKLGNEVLASMQSLRDLFAERASKLGAVQTALQERCAQFSREQETFNTARVEQTQSIEKLEAELIEREQRCAQREKQVGALEADAQAFQKREEQLRARAEEMQALQNKLDEMETRLAERDGRLGGQQQTLEQEAAQLAQQRQAFEARQREFDEKFACFSSDREDFERRCGDLEAAEYVMRRIADGIREHCQALAQERDVVIEACRKLEEQEASLGLAAPMPQTT